MVKDEEDSETVKRYLRRACGRIKIYRFFTDGKIRKLMINVTRS